MSAEVVNLRRARKARKRIDHAEAGAENRARHGRTGAEREAQAIEAERAVRRLDGHRLQPGVTARDDG